MARLVPTEIKYIRMNPAAYNLHFKGLPTIEDTLPGRHFHPQQQADFDVTLGYSHPMPNLDVQVRVALDIKILVHFGNLLIQHYAWVNFHVQAK